jgi:hypothetical protein
VRAAAPTGTGNTPAPPTITSGVPNSGVGTGNINASTGTGTGDDPVLSSNGTPLTDPTTGQPLMVPPGSTIKNGELIGPDGKPILGANGKPIKVPPGAKIGQPQAGGGNVVVPKGSKINSNGEVIGPDGKPVLDSNGNPIMLPKGSSISPDGTVLGPNGKPIPEDTQLLTNQEQALLNPPLLQPGSSPSYSLEPTSSLSMPKLSVPTVGGGEYLGTGSGMSQTALDNGGQLTPPLSMPQTSSSSESQVVRWRSWPLPWAPAPPPMPLIGGIIGASALLVAT